ncbi:MAG: bacteriorhodopsin [Candidatus Dojkabacteria bacterium]
MVETVFLIGAGLFTISSIAFYSYYTLDKASDKSKAQLREFNTPMLVSLVTLVSYIVMYIGDYVVEMNGETIYYTRWFFYAFSCALLMYEISKKLGFNAEKRANSIYLTVVVMLVGMLTAITTGAYQWLFFTISSFAFIAVAFEIFSARPKGLIKSNKEEIKQIRIYVGFFWFLFPVVFLISPTMFALVPVAIAQGLYLILDLITKILFYITLDAE